MIKNVLILGAGFMGSGIAQVLGSKGYKTYIWDINPDMLDKSINTVESGYNILLKKERITEEDKKSYLSNITVVNNINEVESVDLIIEAVVENLEIKKELFMKCYQQFGENAIYASNTSALSISTLSTAIPCSEKFIGLHFFSPVPIMKLVEIVRGIKTSQETVEICQKFIKDIEKVGVLVKDGPGFLVNRVMHAFRNEVIQCLEEGVASLEDIDTAVKLGLGHPMGPFELNDFAGIDIGYATIQTLYDGFKDPKWRPSLTVKHLVEAGDLGRKTGKGWYDYTSGEKKVRTDIKF